MLYYAGDLFKFLFNLYLKDASVGDSLTVLGSSFLLTVSNGSNYCAFSTAKMEIGIRLNKQKNRIMSITQNDLKQNIAILHNPNKITSLFHFQRKRLR